MLEEVIELLNSINKKLEKAAENEKRFGIEMSLELERLSWETYKMANDIAEINNTY